MFRRFFLSVLLLFPLVVVRAADFHADKLAEMDAAIRLAITEGRTPGGVLWVEHGGQSYHAAFGHRAVQPMVEANTEDTIYDAASLTKVMATTPCILLLLEQGKLELDAPVQRYLPEFSGGEKDKVTLRHLLTHTSGTKPGIGGGWQGYEAGIGKACAEPLAAVPGSISRYSDINFILLGEIVRRVAGQPLDEFAQAKFYQPLGMRETRYRPPAGGRARIAPTTAGTERGVVHDPTAQRMGGVAGHAGLFTTAADAARFCRMMLQLGELDGVRVLKPETVRLMTSVQSPANIPGRRGLGWDIDTGYSGPRGRWLPLGSYGHTGWTGGSIWIDPFSQSFVIFLSNRNHPTESGNVLPLRRLLGTLAAEAIGDFNFLHVPGALPPNTATISDPPRTGPAVPAEVLTGIDVLVRDQFAPLRGLRVGLITNHTGMDRQRRRNIDLLAKAEGVTLVSLFSPEHGIGGKLDAKIGDAKDEATGLPIFSLYGDRRAPTSEQLANLDALVFDIQDIGCRFYTYTSTMGECLAVAAREKKKFFVLDRPNPIGGSAVEGPVLEGERSFVGWHEIPVRHGMTEGELARMFNEERKLGVDLTVIPCEGWTRERWFDETSLPWVNPSPNMRSLHAAALYPGIGLLEFCQLSVGRGTDRPFELLGAPYIDDRKLAAALMAEAIPGVRFLPIRYTPTGSVFAGQECGGVQIIVTDRRELNAVNLGLEVARTLQALYPEQWQGDKMAKLLGHPASLQGIKKQQPVSAIQTTWVTAREEFATRRARYLLYP